MRLDAPELRPTAYGMVRDGKGNRRSPFELGRRGDLAQGGLSNHPLAGASGFAQDDIQDKI